MVAAMAATSDNHGKNALALLRYLRDRAPDCMPPEARLAFVMLVLHADGEGRSFPSIEALQRELGLSRRTTLYALEWLETHGFMLRVGGRGRGKRSQFYLDCDPHSVLEQFIRLTSHDCGSDWKNCELMKKRRRTRGIDKGYVHVAYDSM